MNQQSLSALSFDLGRFHRRTVTSFYSNLVTRPTGRAVRVGVEQQLVEAASGGGPCLSILDFSQVRVMDYSCADEIVAKLLMRYAADDRPVDAYFLARGVHDHHRESIEAVLDRHGLLLVTQGADDEARLLGPCTPAEREYWSFLMRRGRVQRRERGASSGAAADGYRPVEATLHRFLATRVAVSVGEEWILPLPGLNHG